MSRFGGPCQACGHPADFHGVTFCMVMAGGDRKQPCDCSGYANPVAPSKSGICGELSPLGEHTYCQLTAGHLGWHEDDFHGSKWSQVPLMPAQPPTTEVLRDLIAQVAHDRNQPYWQPRWTNGVDGEIEAWLGSLIDAGWQPITPTEETQT